jgi:predicted DNA-binding transcriptional regulator YafY
MLHTQPTKKLLMLNILDILKNHSDVNNPLTIKEIGEKLSTEYSQEVERKAIKRNLMNLVEFGCDIEYLEIERTNRRGEQEVICTDFYINRDFDDSELRLLIDSLLFSKHISQNQCKRLIRKLEKLSSVDFKSKAEHICNMPDKTRGNKQLFYTIEILDEAISERKKVSFNYIEHGIDKKTYLRKDKQGNSAVYVVSPYRMAATNGRYYLISNLDPFKNVTNFRIDRITNIKLLDEKSTPMKQVAGLENGLNLPKHMAERIYMFSEKGVQVEFRTKKSLISDVLDWFGYEVQLRKEDDSNVIVAVTVNERAMFFWSKQYGENVEVLSPASLRKKLYEASKNMVEKYRG